MSQKIMVIDDDHTNIHLVKSRLEAGGYQVSTAFDGEEGLEKIKKDRPDLIILDVQMPKMNGYTFMLELKKIKECAALPVVVLTAHETMQPIFALKGVRGYLVKPLNMDQLLAKIKECLGA